jgi:hypothetical protein
MTKLRASEEAPVQGREDGTREGRRGGLNSQEFRDFTRSNGGLRRVNSTKWWLDSSGETGEMDEGVSGLTGDGFKEAGRYGSERGKRGNGRRFQVKERRW